MGPRASWAPARCRMPRSSTVKFAAAIGACGAVAAKGWSSPCVCAWGPQAAHACNWATAQGRPVIK
eukprot:15479792-Alexandrium_andersonii.AAC.1